MLAEPKPIFVWTEVTRAGGRPGLQRAGWFTPYSAQLIVDEALHAGRGGVVRVSVAQDCDDAALARVQHRFAMLRARGVDVDVQRGRAREPRETDRAA